MSLTFHTTTGSVKINLCYVNANQAKFVENFMRHAAMGSYNDIQLLRYIPNFILQTGDPSNTGKQSSPAHPEPLGSYIAPEFSSLVLNGVIRRGTVMTVDNPETTFGSQFFVVLSADNNDSLQDGYTIVGTVEDMSAIEKVEAELSDPTFVKPNGRIRGPWKKNSWIERVVIHNNPFADATGATR